jgi:hypothetical protein
MPFALLAEPALNGQSGLVSMPDARVAPDGTFRLGVSHADPYLTGWSSISFTPRLELSARLTRINAVPGFTNEFQDSYGDYKDKTFDAKFVLLEEGVLSPAVAVGVQDFLGTRIFGAEYVVASKRLGDFDATLGFGRNRIDGVFGGVRYRPPQYPALSLVAEYDANDYSHDRGAIASGAASHAKGGAYGVAYQWGWLGTQLSWLHGEPGLNAWVSIPLNEKEFIPKIDEPLPYTKVTHRPTARQWLESQTYQQGLRAELESQDFRNVQLEFVRGNTLQASLTNTRISLMSRAVGRAARTMLLLAPLETREIVITYTASDLSLATYSFFELSQLRRYFNGLITRRELADYVAVEYATPRREGGGADAAIALEDLDDDAAPFKITQEEGEFIALKREDRLLNRIKILPKFSGYFNDPSGAFRYALRARAIYDKRLAPGLFFNGIADLTVLENVSKVSNPSNSTLPHVRTDIADYEKNGQFRLTKALLNKYYQPSERIYTRASLGYYEEMYAGGGGQILYLPKGGRWAADFSLDVLRQRDTDGGFGMLDYSTTTAMGALHYRLPFHDMTATLRAGQFLAKDIGSRFELKRRFRSGFEIGAWYTWTNGNDITSPGSPDNPYQDKGIYISMPFNTLLTKDTQGRGNFAIAPWVRDVGQMVVSPGDLFDLVEQPLLWNKQDRDGLTQLGDREDFISP